jgi:hypothetical protein
MDAKILGQMSNIAVVQLPTRNFPGIVLQGDTVSTFLRAIDDIRNNCSDPEAMAAADELDEKIRTALRFYEDVLDGEGIKIPYQPRVGRGHSPGTK